MSLSTMGEQTREAVEALMRSYVQKGIAKLDVESPSWRDFVDPSKLDIACEENCVLGQLYGDYETGKNGLFGAYHPSILPWIGYIDMVKTHGFTSTGLAPEAVEILNQAWRAALSGN